MWRMPSYFSLTLQGPLHIKTTVPQDLVNFLGHSSARIDSSQLGVLVQELFMAGLAPATRTSRQLGERWYLHILCCSLAITFPVSE